MHIFSSSIFRNCIPYSYIYMYVKCEYLILTPYFKSKQSSRKVILYINIRVL